MLENLQRTSTAHVGLQPNSQVRCLKIPRLMVSVMYTVIDVMSILKLFQKHVFLYFFKNMASLFRSVRR